MHADTATSRRNLIRALVLCSCTAIFIWQFWNPFVRFSSGRANDAVGLVLALVLPWWALVEFGRIGRWWGIVIAVLALIPLLLYSGLVFLFSAMSSGGAFERVAELDWRGSKICIYQTNGGATTDFGVVIRQEKTILPGIRVVRRVADYYPCADVKVDLSAVGITVNNGQYCPDLPGPREYALRTFVHF